MERSQGLFVPRGGGVFFAQPLADVGTAHLLDAFRVMPRIPSHETPP
jgi:hypothetical protein